MTWVSQIDTSCVGSAHHSHEHQHGSCTGAGGHLDARHKHTCINFIQHESLVSVHRDCTTGTATPNPATPGNLLRYLIMSLLESIFEVRAVPHSTTTTFPVTQVNTCATQGFPRVHHLYSGTKLEDSHDILLRG